MGTSLLNFMTVSAGMDSMSLESGAGCCRLWDNHHGLDKKLRRDALGLVLHPIHGFEQTRSRDWLDGGAYDDEDPFTPPCCFESDVTALLLELLFPDSAGIAGMETGTTAPRAGDASGMLTRKASEPE